MRHWGLLSILLCLVMTTGCSQNRKAGLLQEDVAKVEKAAVAEAEAPPFATKLENYMQLSSAVRDDARRQANSKLDYYERFEKENYEHSDSKQRFWYYRNYYIDRSTWGVGLGNSITGLKVATGMDPSYTEAWGAMGHLLLSSGDPVSAREYLDNALLASRARSDAGDPVDEDIMLVIHQDRAWALRDLTLWDEGLAAVHEGLKFKKGDQDLVLIKGLLLAGAGRYSEANSLAVRMPPYDYKKVDFWHYGYSNTSTNFAQLWIKSQALLAIGDYEMARQVLGELKNREDRFFVPHMARFWNDVGLVAELAGEERGARYYALGFISRPYEGYYPWQGSNLQPLVLNVPDSRMPVYTSFGGKFYVGGSILTYAALQMNTLSTSPFEKQKQVASARALFALNLAERRNIRPAVCRAMRGRIHYTNNHRKEARVELVAARKAFKEQGKVDGGTSLLIGLLEMSDGHNETATALLTEAVEADDQLAAGWRTLGVLHVKAGNKVLAEAAMDKALRLEPNSVSGLYNRGLLRLQDKRFVGSVADLERAYKLDPENHEIQRVLQMAATSYRANGGDPSTLRLQVEEYQVVAVSDGPPLDLVADPAALVAQLNAEIAAFFSVPDSIAATLSPNDEVLKTLAIRYQKSGDPDVRRALALAYLDRGMNLEAQALLAPGWGVDLLPGEEVMLLYVDRLLGQQERGDALAAALISGETFTDNRHLMSLMNDSMRLPWWKHPVNGGHHNEEYSADTFGLADLASIDFMMGVNYTELRIAAHPNLGYADPLRNRWFYEIDAANQGNSQASAVNGGTPVTGKKGSGGYK